MNDFKNIHIGKLIAIKAAESEMTFTRMCNYMKCSQEKLEEMFESKSIQAEDVLRFSKLFQYDFFRIYSHHLILYSPAEAIKKEPISSKLPNFRKRIYTKEIVDFILELVETGVKTKKQVIEDYKIPKTTLYKWIDKHQRKLLQEE
ncbi:transposase [Chryseobacterium nematophagum]|uniref:Transposase n=1 Tax=Chryseobacterium nematophagum TaxID=2305228 RepID=A0A3M7TCX0_9FLAO|nr:transposase [Chryseobacterium nematophagum]RNA61422.1 transposase [Chryseobacterium nematophagum]